MNYVKAEEARKLLGLKNIRSVYEYIDKGLLVRTEQGITLESVYSAREYTKNSKKMGVNFNE